MRKLSEELAAIKDKLKAELQVATQRFEIDIAQLGEKLKSLESKLPEYNEVTAKYEKFRQDYQLIEKGSSTGQGAFRTRHACLQASVRRRQGALSSRV